MQCNCCRGNIEAGQAKCPVCGFPILIGGDNSDATKAIILKHKKNRLTPVSVSLRIYNYICEDGSVREESTEYVKLSDAVNLEYGKITWSDKTYEDLCSSDPFILTVQIQNGSEKTEHQLRFVPDSDISRSAAGIVLGDGFTVRLAVGSKEHYILSDALSLL